MRYLIKNGSIIDPAQRVATIGNVLVEDGLVLRVVDHAELSLDHEAPGENVEVINARGAVIAPGFIDLHCHLREPGDEQRETIASGTLAAARGGFTTVCAMPDTQPPIDNAGIARHVADLARRDGAVRVAPIGALTAGRAGGALAELAELAEAGCVAFGDGAPIGDAGLMRSALAYAAMLELPVIAHCEEPHLTKGWAMHEGAASVRLGLPGFPAAAESIQVARDIALAELTGAHLHISHVSSAASVALIRAARERGVAVTADVTPHHLTLTDRWVLGWLGGTETPAPPARRSARTTSRRKAEDGLGLPSWLDPSKLPPYDARTRVSPPLRSEEDAEALIEGLRDGTIDAIATDHSPTSRVDMEREYRLVEPGISGLETALGLALMLVHRGKLDLVDLVAKLTEGPATVLGNAPATLRPGSPADLVIFDPDHAWTVDPATFASLGSNTPLAGQQLRGQVMLTMVGGQIAFRRGNFGVGTGALRQASKLEGII
jgi:dihydroorotase